MSSSPDRGKGLAVGAFYDGKHYVSLNGEELFAYETVDC